MIQTCCPTRQERRNMSGFCFSFLTPNWYRAVKRLVIDNLRWLYELIGAEQTLDILPSVYLVPGQDTMRMPYWNIGSMVARPCLSMVHLHWDTRQRKSKTLNMIMPCWDMCACMLLIRTFLLFAVARYELHRYILYIRGYHRLHSSLSYYLVCKKERLKVSTVC